MTPAHVLAGPRADVSERALSFTRVFDAPRELVFDAWTDPVHVVRWWGPNGFTTTIGEMDVRPGGVWRLVMHGPDGTDYPNRMIFLEVARPERLVYRHAPDLGDEPVSFQVTVTFADEGGGTRLTMQMLFPLGRGARSRRRDLPGGRRRGPDPRPPRDPPGVGRDFSGTSSTLRTSTRFHYCGDV